MSEFDYLQPILGTCQKNRVFSVHKHSVSGDLHVYYGCELYDVVPDDKEDMRYKLMVTHLYNAKVKLTTLQATFNVDPRTIKRWSNALISGDAQMITKVFAGQKGGRKLTPPIQQYVRTRFPYMYEQDKYTYSSRMLEEITMYFNTDLSSATLRPLFKELKADYYQRSLKGNCDNGLSSDQFENEPTDVKTQTHPERENENENAEPQPADPRSDRPASQIQGAPDDTHKFTLTGSESVPENRKYHVDISTPQWFFHLGALLFSSSLNSLRTSLDEEVAPVVCQWSIQALLGAANLEQSKLLNGLDIARLNGGENPGSPTTQRQKLSDLSKDPDLVKDILRWNFEQVGGPEQSDFYYDPHTKHYTGKQNILKGWCSKLRWADKILIGDYIHTTKGEPIYLENCDNYEDMRQRFIGLEDRFREALKIVAERVLTWVIDRGIYAKEVFEWIVDQPNKHIITWEKDYKKDGWPEMKKADGNFRMQRTRNHSGDLKDYHFEWIDQEHPKLVGLRRIIVRATNPKGNTIEVSILCDDKERAASEVIWLIFDRWVQENDFKYMNAHFGINQITSYESQSYQEISGELADRMMIDAKYSAMERSRRDLKNRVGKLLYQQRESEKKRIVREERIEALEKKALTKRTPEQKKEIGLLKGGGKSAQRYHQIRDKKIATLEQEIQQLSEKMETTDREVSRLDTLIERGAVRLVGERKYLMDVIKLTSRNIFYDALKPFKEAYDNFRDDHVWFRHLSTSPGVIKEGADGELRAYLVLEGDAPKKVIAAYRKILATFNQQKIPFPDASCRKVELVLGEQSTIEISI